MNADGGLPMDKRPRSAQYWTDKSGERRALMLRKMILAGAVVAGSVVAGAGLAGAQDPSPAQVSPTTVQVKGNVVEPAALPRTGSDIGVDVVAGIGLTATGLALAMAARQRRRKYETAAVPAS
jgi:LPXTG-motif cell wall-anchored protein